MNRWKTSLVAIPFSPTAYQEEDADGFRITNEVTVEDGAVSTSGRFYMQFGQAGRREWIDRDLFCPIVMPGILELKRRGIRVFLKRDQDTISEHIAARTLFREMDIIERTGWSGTRFGLPDGATLSDSDDPLPIAYRTGAVNVSVQGTAKQYRKNVAKFAQDQHILLFCMIVSLAAPLLTLSRIQGNFAFMLAGPSNKGKTTCLDVAAALLGPALDGPGGRYYLKFNNTINRLEQLLPFYNDLPFIIDELSSYGSRSSRKSEFRTLVHHLAGVDMRGRLGDEERPAEQTRTIHLITSNDSLDDLLALETPDAAEGVAGRIFEIPVPRGDEGCFNALHPDYPDRRDYAEELRVRVGRYHGAPIRKYLAEVAKLRSQDDTFFRERLNERIAEFANHADVQVLGRLSPRALDAFGLVCAAGELGRVTRVLPRSCDPFAAALHCLHLHLGARAELDPVQRLLGWVSVNRLIDLRDRPLPALSKHSLKRRGAFIGECRSIPQLWIAPQLFKTAFPEGIRLLRDLERRRVLKIEGEGKYRHLTIQCSVRRNERPNRMYVFTIPDLEEWLENNGYPRRGGKRR